MSEFFLKHFIPVALFLVVLTYLLSGLSHLGRYVTTDEQFWIYKRIPQYWNGVKQLNPYKTHINDKPGVTLALVSGAGLLREDPRTHRIKDDKTLDAYDVARTERLYEAFRLPIFLFNGLLLLYLFWIIRKISNVWVALWSTIFIGLSPVLLGISRIVNPDALLWSTAAAALFSYWALWKTHERKFLLLTILFTGLALLAKYVATILFLFFALSFVFFAMSQWGKGPRFLSTLKSQGWNACLLFFGTLLTFSLLMPAVFIKPKYLYEATLGFESLRPFVPILVLAWLGFMADLHFLKGKFSGVFFEFLSRHWRVFYALIFLVSFSLFFFTTINWVTSESLRSLSHVPIDARSSDLFLEGTNLPEKIVLETYPLIFSLTPLVLLLIIALLIREGFFARRKDDLQLYSFLLFSFVLMFLAGGIVSNVLLTTRYMTMLFPIAGLLAAMSFYRLVVKHEKRKYFFPALTLLIILASSLSLWKTKPFYYNYASFLLPPQYIVSSAWGFGGYEAAQYLNSLPESHDIIVWSDYRGVCEFFEGRCIIDRAYDRDEYPIDYYVVTRRGQSRLDNRLLDHLEASGLSPEWNLLIDKRPQNYIKIYRNPDR